jgi:hypothetical protein
MQLEQDKYSHLYETARRFIFAESVPALAFSSMQDSLCDRPFEVVFMQNGKVMA